MKCPGHLARDLSGEAAAKVGHSAVGGQQNGTILTERLGADREDPGRYFAGDGQEDHLVAGGRDFPIAACGGGKRATTSVVSPLYCCFLLLPLAGAVASYVYRPLLPLLAAIGLASRQHCRCRWLPAPHRLEVNRVRVFVLHPIVPAFEKYSGPPVFADRGVHLKLCKRIPQEPLRPQRAVRTPHRAGSAGRGCQGPGPRFRIAAHTAYIGASPHRPSRKRADTVASNAYLPPEAQQTKPISPRPGVLVALLDMLQGEEWS
jgi:hypothetical protein